MAADPSPTTADRLRWFHPTPARLLFVLLVLEGLLFLSERSFPKGYAVLIAIATVIAATLLTLIWWLAALCFRWRFQFSLRSLLVLTVAVAIPFSWLAVEMKRAKEQRDAVEAIRKLDGSAYYDYMARELGVSGGRRSLESKFLLRLFGIDFFHSVVWVGLSTYDPDHMGHPIHSISENDVSCLDRLRDLRSLGLRQQSIGDATLAHLTIFPELEELDIAGTMITDAGLAHLTKLTRLKCLCLSDTRVSDAGLEHLNRLPQLKTLHLNGTKVTEEGIDRRLQALPPNCKVYH
jgi:hypothetical protein